MRVREWGDVDAAATLLWPGLGFTGIYFAELAGRLPRAVALDPPGHGASPPRDWDAYSLERLAVLAGEVARDVGADAFVGHSWGASVGAALGARQPEWLRVLVLVDGGFIAGSERADFGLPESDDRETLRAYVSEATSGHDSWDGAFSELRDVCGGVWPAHGDAIVREVFVEEDGRVRERCSAEGAAAILGALAHHDPVECAERISAAAVPTLVIASGRTPYLAAKRRACDRFITAGAPTIRLHFDERIGHHPLLESPETYVPLVSGWVRDPG